MFFIERANKRRVPVGTLVYVKKCEKFPEGLLGKVISYNTFQCEYQVTTKLNSIPSPTNPYILENEETGLKVTQEEFDNNEFIRFEDAQVVDFEPIPPVIKFLNGSVAKVAMGVLLFCSGALVALEFLK